MITVPDWLMTRNCTLKPGIDGLSWFVCLGAAPQYEVTPLPVQGKFGCEIRQTVNGRRLDKGSVYTSEQEALQGGLNELRAALGW